MTETLNYVLPVHLHSLNQCTFAHFVSSSHWTAIQVPNDQGRFSPNCVFSSFQNCCSGNNKERTLFAHAKKIILGVSCHYIIFTDKDKAP